MRVDLDTEQAAPASLPRFQRAAFQARRLARLAISFGAIAALALVFAIFIGLFAPDSVWPVLLVDNACALLILAAGFQSAYWLSDWRRRHLLDHDDVLTPRAVEVEDAALADSAGYTDSNWYERLIDRLGRRAGRIIDQVGMPAFWLAGFSAVILIGIQQSWRLDLPAGATGVVGSLAGATALLAAFALLVLERQLTHEHPTAWPEAAGLAQLTRSAIAVLVLSSLSLFFGTQGNVWTVRLAVLIGLLPAAIAVEFLLRTLFSLFSPRRRQAEPRVLAKSLSAELLRWPPRPLQNIQDELHNRFGIDLRQIWAFGFMRRAFLPIFLIMALLGWSLSGISQVPLAGRGIYERFGKPIEVLGPGLHVGLPWPFGRMIAVENGVVHELATTVNTEGSPDLIPDTAEAPAPASADRLWDATHTSEKSQVIASSAGDKQSFQVVNMDLRFVYRIGLDDHAALAATYNSADVPTLIRSTASRILVHDFANRTLDDLLGAQRTELAGAIGQQLQADLDKLGSGVELLATVVEAIHPPAGAANAYHAVQAAQISAQALIARERGAASEQANQAQLSASVAHDQALAGARETSAGAQAADLRFTAERQAYASAGQAFLLEQYLAQLSQGLSHAPLLILDHRLSADSAPTVDLRTFALPADPTAPRKAAK